MFTVMTPLAPPRAYRFTVDQYHAMARAGVLSPEARVELIDGQIITMSPVGRTHLTVVNRLNRLLVLLAGKQVIVSVQNPIRLDDGSEPEPDLSLFRAEVEGELPTAADTLLVIEVADTTEAFDRHVKLPRYAMAGIPEAWLVLVGEREAIEVHRRPGPEGYAHVERFTPTDSVPVRALTDAPRLDLADVFPPERA